MKAFAYPKTHHRRGPDPGPYSSHHTYKPHLRDEFGGACIYCRVRDTLNRTGLFSVEHYMPQKHFPGRATDWTNLYYACSRCNRLKSDFYPRGRVATVKFVPNPCDHVMFDHLRYVGATVHAHSEAGQFALESLDLNAPVTVQYREFFERSVEDARLNLVDARKTVKDIGDRLVSATGQRLAALTAGLAKAEAQVTSQEDNLRYLWGTYQPLPL